MPQKIVDIKMNGKGVLGTMVNVGKEVLSRLVQNCKKIIQFTHLFFKRVHASRGRNLWMFELHVFNHSLCWLLIEHRSHMLYLVIEHKPA